MSWLNGLSDQDKAEMYLDATAAYNCEIISEKEFRATLVKLGYNATDIEDAVKQHAPIEGNPD
jgi:hypothetical protein